MLSFGVTEKKALELSARMARYEVRESDLQEKFVRGGGPGGQKINKTSVCVILKHIPSGIEVRVQQGRSQSINRYYARKRLCELIENKILGSQSPQHLEQAKIRKQKNRRKRRSSSVQ